MLRTVRGAWQERNASLHGWQWYWDIGGEEPILHVAEGGNGEEAHENSSTTDGRNSSTDVDWSLVNDINWNDTNWSGFSEVYVGGGWSDWCGTWDISCASLQPRTTTTPRLLHSREPSLAIPSSTV